MNILLLWISLISHTENTFICNLTPNTSPESMAYFILYLCVRKGSETLYDWGVIFHWHARPWVPQTKSIEGGGRRGWASRQNALTWEPTVFFSFQAGRYYFFSLWSFDRHVCLRDYGEKVLETRTNSSNLYFSLYLTLPPKECELNMNLIWLL